MKKLLSLLITISIILATLLNGCSCSSASIINFSSGKYSGETLTPGVKETMHYTISNEDKFNSSLEKDTSLDNLFTYSYSGSFETTLEVVLGYPNTLPASSLYKVDNTDYVYKFSTKMNLTATYTIEGNEQTYNDSSESVIYFFSAKSSFAPIYSETKSKTSYVTISSNNKVKIEEHNFSNTILYNSKSAYKITTQIDEKSPKTNSYEYEYKTVIDNAELLFAIRAFKVSKGSSSSLAVVSSAYGEAQTLSVSNTNEGENTFSLKVNSDSASDYLIKTKNYSFCISDSEKSGKSQYLTLQKSEVDGIGDLNLLLSYAQPISIYYDGTYKNMGALVFSLDKISTSN